MKSKSFKSYEHIRLRRDFQNLYKSKNRLVSSFFVIVYIKNELEYPRIAVSIRKKFGKAVCRNKLKRYIKEIYRLNKELFLAGYDYLFIPRKSLSARFSEISFFEIETHLKELMGKLKWKDSFFIW